MSANVETMFSARETPWHGLGKIIAEAVSSKEALELAGLDWNVESRPMFIEANNQFLQVPGVIANVRDSDNSVLGTVTSKYKIVQNQDAFSFTDALLGNDVKYETAGSLNHGKRVWMLAKMPETEILGDKFEQYLVFVNSHDGKGAIQICATPIRVVCQNTANLALKTAKRSWTTKHMGNMELKMAEAHRTLELATKYTAALRESAEIFVKQKFTIKQFTTFVETILPTENDDSERQVKNIEFMRNDLTERFLKAPDLENFRFTKWGVLNAVSDFATHRTAMRETETFKERQFSKVIDGHPFMDEALEIIEAM